MIIIPCGKERKEILIAESYIESPNVKYFSFFQYRNFRIVLFYITSYFLCRAIRTARTRHTFVNFRAGQSGLCVHGARYYFPCRAIRTIHMLRTLIYSVPFKSVVALLVNSVTGQTKSFNALSILSDGKYLLYRYLY